MDHAAVARTVILAAALFAGPVAAATPDCPVAPGDPLARGFSLTGWFDDVPARPPEARMLADLRARGMTHVRLPVRAETLSPRFTPAADVARTRRAVAAAIDRLLALDFAVVVDLHGGDALETLFRTDASAAERAVIAIWTELGPILAARPAGRVFAEILNEPPLDDATWARMQAEIVAAARRVMPSTTLILSTGGPQRVERLAASTPLPDPATVWAVHYYDPMVFTHQGADWMRPDPIAELKGVPFPFRGDDRRLAALAATARAGGAGEVATYLDSLRAVTFGLDDIERHMARLADWSRARSRPVVIGEFGVYRGAAAPAERRAWLAAVTAAAERHCLGWTHWEFRDGFGFVNADGRLDTATLAALLPLAPLPATARPSRPASARSEGTP
ncbi:hypothetical protein EYW49_08715 [Siculibacillus lacustris]|uniref:Exo-1,3-beta-glucanase D n=1 Tax=Siculibacillus lacustris TaxID=1549641 RepID=A0A4Q9VUE7_9HYPH|nr:cellulase family glycosylhydrolase [Siculibacillus lacustris]TBW38763.1 hypothetical protein EYW49_08715 [Siculibacillus lacustris]